MHFQQIPPPDYLKPYVRYYWTLENHDRGDQLKTFSAIADGCPGLIFQQLSGTNFYDKDEKKLPACFLYGQTTGHRELYTPQQFRQIGVYFQPHALRTVFGIDAGALTDSCTDLGGLSRPEPFNLPERLLGARSLQEQIDVLSQYLFHLIQRNNLRIDARTQQIASYIAGARGDVSLPLLQRDLGISERSLERRFREHIGVSPKLFARIGRFQAALDCLRGGQYDKLSDIAFEHGYADQSHFIRTFREFAGCSPLQFHQQSNELIENFPERTGTKDARRKE
ncbi:helix-turn-helix domain-containing protein [Dawidia soli]|uniref:Helix-turn-helix transcriptional regulator n=1 Tax=Dawidia soli TaxID=2782352 RepID=A0AAP2D7K4_9BACT|nr:helix-turn-helix domain-containing protein [Dawidia soli]MBT1685455.1 helix-turn-helix transcriptional regulator [Dawidia soli]